MIGHSIGMELEQDGDRGRHRDPNSEVAAGAKERSMQSAETQAAISPTGFRSCYSVKEGAMHPKCCRDSRNRCSELDTSVVLAEGVTRSGNSRAQTFDRYLQT